MLANKISFILAFSAGLLGVTQGMINAYIGKVQGQYGMIIGVSAIQIAFASFLLWRVKSAPPLQLQVIPWILVAGILGVGIMFSTSYATGKIGTVSVFILIIAGQLVASSIIDHLGLMGLPKNPFTLGKFGSILLIMLGVFCLPSAVLPPA
ncbi:DMT family transporter [Paenibacillus sp. GP183]|jgi:transporter family-2 protein|uniref:DMT family transporter n=1 Tax=Paenibacillus sp. GP183 TaxID=1882751 RepID=UPI0008981FA2|nr:DMT family transporter [Paenibacillus sp. GP183]SEB51784.1 transporter family-2 protein [Paenibacillus sp. GP183]